MELDNKQTCFEYLHAMGELLSNFLNGSDKPKYAFRDGKKIHDRYYQEIDDIWDDLRSGNDIYI